jgi:hypothetical protein
MAAPQPIDWDARATATIDAGVGLLALPTTAADFLLGYRCLHSVSFDIRASNNVRLTANSELILAFERARLWSRAPPVIDPFTERHGPGRRLTAVIKAQERVDVEVSTGSVSLLTQTRDV